ncbi:DUF7829 domain-containing protein [Lacibacter sediminis]|uniref:DUF7829 domain-containing protein n=1 Tax=Lacibacter sediminis TaxID=2760713 RepID=A0A7G5XFN4_9BACT|nr:DUF6035 family protein [Lacibacter sediminis]QNA44287.1 hypothetical protein H4075_19825 [Lacibacter sediminis]
MNPYRKQTLEKVAIHFCDFFLNPTKPKFYGSTALHELDAEESKYIKSIIQGNLNIPWQPTDWLIDSFIKPERINLAVYLIESPFLAPDLQIEVKGETAFTILVKFGMTMSDKKDFMYMLQKLYERGYQSKSADLVYLKSSYEKLKNEYQCLTWSLARFAYKLNNSVLIAKAFQHHMPLLSIASFKMRRPFGINYHNLLGIANNALQHYRSHIELIIHAMETYDVIYDIKKRDHKGTFKQRMEDYYETMPPQDPDIAEVAFFLFPELKEVSSTSD